VLRGWQAIEVVISARVLQGEKDEAHESESVWCVCEESGLESGLTYASGCLMVGVGREGGAAAGQFDELTYAGAFTGEVKSGRVKGKYLWLESERQRERQIESTVMKLTESESACRGYRARVDCLCMLLSYTICPM
jgi:hypothetical protein